MRDNGGIVCSTLVAYTDKSDELNALEISEAYLQLCMLPANMNPIQIALRLKIKNATSLLARSTPALADTNMQKSILNAIELYLGMSPNWNEFYYQDVILSLDSDGTKPAENLITTHVMMQLATRISIYQEIATSLQETHLQLTKVTQEKEAFSMQLALLQLNEEWKKSQMTRGAKVFSSFVMDATLHHNIMTA